MRIPGEGRNSKGGGRVENTAREFGGMEEGENSKWRREGIWEFVGGRCGERIEVEGQEGI